MGKFKMKSVWAITLYFWSCCQFLACAGTSAPSSHRLEEGVGNPNQSTVSRQFATPQGIYALESLIPFNVLDRVVFDPKTHELTLMGHESPEYSGQPIQYFQHLATLLEYPQPRFSLEWTPDSERSVAELFRRMDSDTEMARLVESSLSGEWFDRNGQVTQLGRSKLHIFGIRPTVDGREPGYLGITVDFPRGNSSNLQVTRVTPGSPASLAGIHVGDGLFMVNGEQPQLPEELNRLIRRAGKGSKIKIEVDRMSGFKTVYATLDRGSGDPWQGETRMDVVALLLEQGGNKKGANLLEAWQRMQRLAQADRDISSGFFGLFMASTGTYMTPDESIDAFTRIRSDIQQGRRSQKEVMRDTYRKIMKGMEKGFEFPSGLLTSVFDRAISLGKGSSAAFDIATAEMNRQMKISFKPVLRRALHRQKEIVLDVSEVENRLGAKPVVVPSFLELDPHSQLARVMFEADYLGKTLLWKPELQNKIPRYQTEYAFYADRPKAKGNIREVNRRMWISFDELDLVQSPDGTTLEIRRAAMRFNVQDVEGNGISATSKDPYGELLTSVSKELAIEFPILHELGEAAKLAGVAHWIRDKVQGFRLPAVGRAVWQPPQQVPGLVNLIWSPNRVSVVMVAPGGVDLVFPFGQIPVDSDLRDAVRDEAVGTTISPQGKKRRLSPFDHRKRSITLKPPRKQTEGATSVGGQLQGVGGKKGTSIRATQSGSHEDAVELAEFCFDRDCAAGPDLPVVEIHGIDYRHVFDEKRLSEEERTPEILGIMKKGRKVQEDIDQGMKEVEELQKQPRTPENVMKIFEKKTEVSKKEQKRAGTTYTLREKLAARRASASGNPAVRK